MRREHLLESKTYVAGNMQFSLQNLPTGKRVNAIRLRMTLLFTHGAAAAAIAGVQLFRLFQNVQLGRLIDATGLLLHNLNWIQRGAEDYLPAGIPATNAGTFRRNVCIDIPWFDQSSGAPGDLAQNSEEQNTLAVSINIPAFATLGAGTWDTLASIAGTVRCFAILDDASKQVNPKVRIGYIDATTQSPTLPAGLYENVFVYNEDGTGITNAEVTGVSGKADGEVLFDNLTLEEKVEIWNDQHAKAGNNRTDSATAPVAGSRLTCEPAFTSGAATTVTTEILPLVTKVPRGQLSQAAPASQGLSFQFAGTKTTFRLAFKMIEPHTESDLVASFHKQGVPVRSLAQVQPKTDSKAPLTASKTWLAKYLPARARLQTK